MDANQLQQFQKICETLYNSADPVERSQAEKALAPFFSKDFVLQCKFLLENSPSPYVQHFSVSRIMDAVSNHWNSFSSLDRVEIRNHLLNFLATHGPKLLNFVTINVIQLVSRITKLAWFDDPSHQEILQNVGTFLKQNSNPYYLLGLKLVSQLITEMNEQNPGLLLTEHRKIANSFRDKVLLDIFKLSLTTLGEIYGGGSLRGEDVSEEALNVALKCLSFDFIGSAPDESTDDAGSVQIPSSWRTLFEDSSTLKLFLQIYLSSRPELGSIAMKCLGQLASIRPSLWNAEKARDTFLGDIVGVALEILRTQHGLGDQRNHHEFCRVLSKLKGNFQLSKIIATDGFAEWISLITGFTVKTFEMWQWSPNSVYYLLSFWARLITSVAYVKTSESSALLENYAPQIMEAYITSRMKMIKNYLQANSSDVEALDEEEEQIMDQLEATPTLSRCRYSRITSFLISLFDPLAQSFKDMIEKNQVESLEFKLVQVQLNWLVFAIGPIVGGRAASSSEEDDFFDAELSSRVFQLMALHDLLLRNTPNVRDPWRPKMETSFLHFIQFFRKVYIGDQARTSSRIYKRLGELLGINDELMILNLITRRIGTNLQFYGKNEVLLDKTLSLLLDLASGYGSSKALTKLETTGQFLAFHTSNFFPFLDYGSNLKRRTVYYNSLARLLYIDDNPSKFEKFMEPFLQKLLFLKSQTTPEAFYREECKNCIISLARDFRGMAIACGSNRTYNMLFNFLYPEHLPIFSKAVQVWSTTPAVTTPILRLFADFAYNKGGRIFFDSSSVNGILLFRECSRLMVSYGSQMINYTPRTNEYEEKYKGIYIALMLIHRCLVGNYCNFGVFGLYGDPALSDALDVSIKLTLSIPNSDIMIFNKLMKSYFSFLEVLFNSHITSLIALPSVSFSKILHSITDGLECVEVTIVSQCCAALDRLLTYHLNRTSKDMNVVAALSQHIAEHMELLCNVLGLLFRKVLFEDCQNHWSLSRAMFSLILLNPDNFTNLKNKLIARQPPELAPRLMKDFQDLMGEVQSSLESTNRDKFSTNLHVFITQTKKYVSD